MSSSRESVRFLLAKLNQAQLDRCFQANRLARFVYGMFEEDDDDDDDDEDDEDDDGCGGGNGRSNASNLGFGFGFGFGGSGSGGPGASGGSGCNAGLDRSTSAGRQTYAPLRLQARQSSDSNTEPHAEHRTRSNTTDTAEQQTNKNIATATIGEEPHDDSGVQAGELGQKELAENQEAGTPTQGSGGQETHEETLPTTKTHASASAGIHDPVKSPAHSNENDQETENDKEQVDIPFLKLSLEIQDH
jgi:hypothetical protein